MLGPNSVSRASPLLRVGVGEWHPPLRGVSLLSVSDAPAYFGITQTRLITMSGELLVLFSKRESAS